MQEMGLQREPIIVAQATEKERSDESVVEEQYGKWTAEEHGDKPTAKNQEENGCQNVPHEENELHGKANEQIPTQTEVLGRKKSERHVSFDTRVQYEDESTSLPSESPTPVPKSIIKLKGYVSDNVLQNGEWTCSDDGDDSTSIGIEDKNIGPAVDGKQTCQVKVDGKQTIPVVFVQEMAESAQESAHSDAYAKKENEEEKEEEEEEERKSVPETAVRENVVIRRSTPYHGRNATRPVFNFAKVADASSLSLRDLILAEANEEKAIVDFNDKEAEVNEDVHDNEEDSEDEALSGSELSDGDSEEYESNDPDHKLEMRNILTEYNKRRVMRAEQGMGVDFENQQEV